MPRPEVSVRCAAAVRGRALAWKQQPKASHNGQDKGELMARFTPVWANTDLASQHQLAARGARVQFLKGIWDDSSMRARISWENPMAVPAAPFPPPNYRGNCFCGAVWRGDLGLRFDPDSSRERCITSRSALAERFWVHFRIYLTDDGRRGNQSFLLNTGNKKIKWEKGNATFEEG